jgi:hypothetical protein
MGGIDFLAGGRSPSKRISRWARIVDFSLTCAIGPYKIDFVPTITIPIGNKSNVRSIG